MHKPRLMLAAPASGSGKTMLTCGILKALCMRGMRVASFKCGPDYIDPMFHEKVIGAKSGNLDLFFSEADTLRRLFCTNAEGTDISIIEGVMGFYDGLAAASERASSYDVARTLQVPVVLILNARGQSLSALAALKGFADFRADSGIRGVIFNQMSEHTYHALAAQVRQLGFLPLGFVPRAEELVIESRHLGLVTPGEIEDLTVRLEGLAQLLEKTLDLDVLIALANSAPELECPRAKPLAKLPETTVAVARDEAFCFLYRDNLQLLQRLGARLAYFSPLHDEALPDGAQGLILPGGYPELYAEALSRNTGMLHAVAAAIRGGMPCLAECGGFMYLHREMEDMHARFYPMAGVIDGRAYRTDRLGRFGYITLTAEASSAFLRSGEQIRAHEFHYFDSENCGAAMRAEKPASARSWKCMHAEGTLLAGFPHLFYESNPQLAVHFLQCCAGGGN